MTASIPASISPARAAKLEELNRTEEDLIRLLRLVRRRRAELMAGVSVANQPRCYNGLALVARAGAEES